MNQEVAELLTTLSTKLGNTDKIAAECADVLITLYRVAGLCNFDLLEEVDKKMDINYKRKWKLDGSGCGQHTEE